MDLSKYVFLSPFSTERALIRRQFDFALCLTRRLAMKRKSNTSNIIVYFFYWAQLLSLITNLCKKHKPFIQFMSFRQKIDIDKHTGIHWHYLTQGNSYILLCVNKKGITRGRSASIRTLNKTEMGFECYKSIKCK